MSLVFPQAHLHPLVNRWTSIGLDEQLREDVELSLGSAINPDTMSRRNQSSFLTWPPHANGKRPTDQYSLDRMIIFPVILLLQGHTLQG